MRFHLDYLLALPGVSVETCTQVEGKIFLGLSILSEGIVCHHCNNHTEKLHQNRPILVRDLSVFACPVYLKSHDQQFGHILGESGSERAVF
ncbi:transposase family protein [Microcoleus sp. S28C3]|uniref:transposase family protein n=1 Tax=Microcoleus sp. S28C3 TaxID=3055414 RepID=UPI002FCF83F5